MCSDLGLNPRNQEGRIGRLVARKWRQKYNKGPNESPPKRDTLYQGKVIKANAYFSEDYDILKQACEEILLDRGAI